MATRRGSTSLLGRKAPRSKKRRIAAAIAGLCAATLAVLARGPDRALSFERTVPFSDAARARAIRTVGDPQTWSEWFYSTASVEAPQGLRAEAPLTLQIDPHKGEWKKFRVYLEVQSWEHSAEGARLKLRVKNDSKGRIAKQFADVEWTIEVAPGKLTGRARARTLTWRSRLMSRLSERIVMNQLFYPNLMRLAETLTRPEHSTPSPEPGLRLAPGGM